MFKKLHLQMTLFCTLVTGSIVIFLSLLCLSFAENGLRQSSYSLFLAKLNTVITHLQGQDTVSHQWLNQIHEDGHFMLFLYDNNIPLYYQRYHPSLQDSALIQEVIAEAKNGHNLDIFNPSYSKLSAHAEFAFESSKGVQYYASAGTIPKQGGHLSFLVLSSLENQNTPILHFRLAVAAAGFSAILLLAVFSWFFTRKLILPLAENQKKQTLFIASASHELRAPLAVLLSGLEAIGKTHTPQEQSHFMTLMAEEGHRMQLLIDDMLLLAGADSHSLKLNSAPCQPDGLLLNVYEKYEILAKQNQISLSISLPQELLPDCLCDAQRMTQLLSILLDNALSYTPAGGRIGLALSLQKSAHKGRDAFQFEVTDTGCGIPDSDKPYIFDRFYRAQQSHTDKAHYGLGLCIAKEIVLAHHGKIQVTDGPEGGTRFSVLIPLLNLF